MLNTPGTGQRSASKLSKCGACIHYISIPSTLSVLIYKAVCRQHPWFTLHLPRYLAVMQAGTVATSATLDPEIVEEVSRLTGYPADTVADSVRASVQDKVAFDYYLFFETYS